MSFLTLTSRPNLSQTKAAPYAETMGSMAFISKPSDSRPTETQGSIASAGSLCGATPAGCGSNCNVCA